jgi:hypothetical protein
MDDDYFFGPSCPSLSVQSATNWGTSNIRQSGVLQPGTAVNVDAYFKYQANSNAALDRIFGKEVNSGDRIAELHRPYLIGLCTLQRAQRVLVPSERQATVRSKFRNPASDLTLQFFYSGLLSSLGLMTDVMLTDMVSEVAEGAVISKIYSELHWPSHGYYDRDLQSQLKAALAKIEETKPCYLNIQGYRKGDPGHIAVSAFFERSFPIPSPVEAQWIRTSHRLNV